MREGKKFRPPKATKINFETKTDAFDSVQAALYTFAERQARLYKIRDDLAFQPWITHVLHLVQQHLMQMLDGNTISFPDAPAYGPQEKRIIESLQQRFLIIYCDKSGNNLAFACKGHAIQAVLDDMNSNSTYHLLGVAADDLIDPLLDRIARIGKKPIDHCLPIISLLPKMHKPTIAWRFLSLSYRSFLKPSAILLTRVLRGLTPDMFNCGVIFLSHPAQAGS